MSDVPVYGDLAHRCGMGGDPRMWSGTVRRPTPPRTDWIMGTGTAMTNLSPEAQRLMARQHGVVIARPAARHWPHASAGRTTRGGPATPARGARRVSLPHRTVRRARRCAAICVARPDVAIAAVTAGRIWGLRRLPHDARIHIVGPRASNPAIAPWVAAYRTAAIRDRTLRTTGRPEDHEPWSEPRSISPVRPT